MLNIDQQNFHYAAMHAKYRIMTAVLSSATGLKGKKEIVTSKNEHDITPLHRLAESRRLRSPKNNQHLPNSLRLLLKNGADIDARDTYERTPLMLAALEGDSDVVELLLNHGANPNLKDSEAVTAAMLAEFNNDNKAEEIKTCLARAIEQRSIYSLFNRELGIKNSRMKKPN